MGVCSHRQLFWWIVICHIGNYPLITRPWRQDNYSQRLSEKVNSNFFYEDFPLNKWMVANYIKTLYTEYYVVTKELHGRVHQQNNVLLNAQCLKVRWILRRALHSWRQYWEEAHWCMRFHFREPDKKFVCAEPKKKIIYFGELRKRGDN